MPITTASNS